MPTPGTTVPAFGGPNGDIMIVGSGIQGYDFVANKPLRKYAAPAGSVFLFTGFAEGNLPLLPQSATL